MATNNDALIGAVDQGTSSTRFLVFSSKTGELITHHQVEIEQIHPQERWFEEDANEILQSVIVCINEAIKNLEKIGISRERIKAIGMTTQMCTTVVWDKTTGIPLFNAIVWVDGRNADHTRKLVERTPSQSVNHFLHATGFRMMNLTMGTKLSYLMENNTEYQNLVASGRCMVGTIDSWILWNLTGGVDGGQHLTDVTNASHTQMMNIHTLNWDPEICKFFDVEMETLPEIRSSSEIYGYVKHPGLQRIAGLPISGILGDQPSALVGQCAFQPGQAKCTYGTAAVLLVNIGTEPVFSQSGGYTAVTYKMGKDAPAILALEGMISVAGCAIRWLRDQMGIINTASEIEELAGQVENTGGCFFVPAFAGLDTPYWDSNARGTICGLTLSTTKAHLVRACLEGTCFQTRDLLESIAKDHAALESLQVDGGMTANNLFLQMLADICGIDIARPPMVETTALGAAIAAGAAAGVDLLKPEDFSKTKTFDRFSPRTTKAEREQRYATWKKAVKRAMNWEQEEEAEAGM